AAGAITMEADRRSVSTPRPTARVKSSVPTAAQCWLAESTAAEYGAASLTARYRTPDNAPVCWGCFVAKCPDRAKLKVRKEHLMLAELQRRLPWLGEKAEQLIWDCPVPGGCTLKRPDMLFRLEDRFVQIEVDEEGHEDLSCADEDSRLELIAADVGLPGLVLRLNPDAERILKRRRCTNGEPCFCVGDADAFNGLFDAAEAAAEAFVNEPAPEGVR
ncbi:unnamed protein product, partial [Symbiodinium sp. KB8]